MATKKKVYQFKNISEAVRKVTEAQGTAWQLLLADVIDNAGGALAPDLASYELALNVWYHSQHYKALTKAEKKALAKKDGKMKKREGYTVKGEPTGFQTAIKAVDGSTYVCTIFSIIRKAVTAGVELHDGMTEGDVKSAMPAKEPEPQVVPPEASEALFLSNLQHALQSVAVIPTAKERNKGVAMVVSFLKALDLTKAQQTAILEAIS